MARNPYPDNVTDPMWELWEGFYAHNPKAKLSGFYANKPGYHNKRQNLPGSDYSSGRDVANDKLGPSDKASAIDITLNEADMKLYSKRLRDACVRRDKRLFKDGQPIIREFIGTLDGSNVYCYVLTGGRALGVGKDSGPDSGRDKSHLWHIHISIIRKFANDREAMKGLLSVLTGEEEDMPLSDADVEKIVVGVLSANAGSRSTPVRWIDRTNEISKKVDALEEKLDSITFTTGDVTVSVSDEQLERVLRKIVGSVDNLS